MKLKENVAKWYNAQAEIERINERIKKLEAKQTKLERMGWISTFFEPFAAELAAAVGFQKWEILGPFGLACRTSIWLYNTAEERENLKVVSLTVEPDIFNPENPFGFVLVDETQDTGRYEKGTIGEANGMNHPTAPLPAGADMSFFVDLINQRRGVGKEITWQVEYLEGQSYQRTGTVLKITGNYYHVRYTDPHTGSEMETDVHESMIVHK